jgi:hypothetical protein
MAPDRGDISHSWQLCDQMAFAFAELDHPGSFVGDQEASVRRHLHVEDRCGEVIRRHWIGDSGRWAGQHEAQVSH